MCRLILQPPLQGLLVEQQIRPGQLQFLFQKVLATQKIAFQGLFPELLRLLVLVSQAFLDYPGLLPIANRFALIQGMATGELLLLVALLNVDDRGPKRATLERMEGLGRRRQSGGKNNNEKRGNT